MSKALSILSKDSTPILLQLSRNVPARAADARLKLCILVLPSSTLKCIHVFQYISKPNTKIV